jgi:hypothetical protein
MTRKAAVEAYLFIFNSLILLTFLCIALASASSALADDALSVRSSMSWYTYGSVLQPVEDSPVNPDNTVLQLDDQTGGIDIRPDIRAMSGALKLIARPQLKMQVSKAIVGGKDRPERPKSSGRWIESYGLLTASDKVQVSFGLQNYQWGAAESLNPSNRIFHENIDGKGLLYTVEGRNLGRVNISWTKRINTVLMSETEKAKDTSLFRAEETFQTKALMKHEINWNNGADYIGVVYGAPETGDSWFGEYFNLSLFDGLSFYVDAAHQKNSEAWYPVLEASAQAPNQQVVQLRQSKIGDGKFYTLAVAGLRYSFEGGSDLRFEYIANDAGWSKEESQRAVLALNLKSPLQVADYSKNLQRILKPGLEYRGKSFALLSWRIPDVFDVKDFVVYVRTLRSVIDGSATYYGSTEYSFGSASTLIFSAYSTQGSTDSDLRGVASSVITAGLRQDF